MISTAVPVKKISSAFNNSLGKILFSIILILFFFANLITVCLVIQFKKQSAIGVYNLLFFTKKIFAPVDYAT